MDRPGPYLCIILCMLTRISSLHLRTRNLKHHLRAMSTWSRLVRFHPRSNPSTILIGEPVDAKVDVGLATYAKEAVEIKVWSGSSVVSPGEQTERVETIDRLLSPVSRTEVGTIRCIGLNVSLQPKACEGDRLMGLRSTCHTHRRWAWTRLTYRASS